MIRSGGETIPSAPSDPVCHTLPRSVLRKEDLSSRVTWVPVPWEFGQWEALAGDEKTGGERLEYFFLFSSSLRGCDDSINGCHLWSLTATAPVGPPLSQGHSSHQLSETSPVSL